jgi:hypothetical protein
MRITALLSVLFFAALTSLAHAAPETRGLRVVAKDPATGQSDEVKLYNKSYAVIIGIDNYKNLPRDRQLKNAVKDAKGVEAVLNKNYRFDKIVSIYNQEATRDRILEVLTEELPAIMGDQDSLFLFWAGHGDQEKGTGGREMGYLIPYDGEIGKIRKNLTMQELRSTISSKLPAKHVFYVMDACYGGLLASTRSVDKKSRRDLSYLKEITRENVRQVLTAGGQGEEVLDGGPKGHSVFTGRLIEALEASGDFITANEIQAILKEKVYGDSRAQGKTQTPAFGTLSGTGDYVFVPNIDQKVADGAAELERMAKERKALEQQIVEASKANDEQKRREAERQKDILIQKQRYEEDKQKQLAEEQRRIEEQARRQREFEAEQKRKQEELLRQAEEEKRNLEKLKGKVGAFPTMKTSTLEAAVAEIRKLSAEIDAFEAEITREQTVTERRIKDRYDTLIADVKTQRLAAEKNRPVKDRFETEAEFRERLRTHLHGYDSRLTELAKQKATALSEARSSLETARVSRTTGLREEMKKLTLMEYSVDPSTLVVDLGDYDAEKQRFPVTIRNRVAMTAVDGKEKKKQKSATTAPRQEPPLVKVAMSGVLYLPKKDARQFDQVYRDKPALIRPEIMVRPNGDIMKVAIANDAENYLLEYLNGEFITITEKKRRQEAEEQERERKRREAERERERERQTVGDMVNVPAGCFKANNTQVCLDAFRIGKYEVTQRQWQRVIGNNPSNFKSCGDDCPVESVSWNDIQQYLQKLNSQTGKRYRLPTEAEWHYACTSGGRNEEYCGGNDVDSVAWYDKNSGSKTHRVGTKQPNGLGIYDMSGNVWEWVSDWYDDTYPTGSRNPTGASSGDKKVLRGGSWYSTGGGARAAIRYWFYPDNRDINYGFRLAVSED